MSIQNLRKEVEMLQSALTPNMKTINLHFTYGDLDKPHGVMGHRIQQLTLFRGQETQKYYAVNYREEMEHYTKDAHTYLLSHNRHIKNDPTHIWHTYENWIEYNRCKCGKHGADNKQPYGETLNEILP